MDGDMDRIHAHFTVRTSFSFLLLILLQTSIEAQICSVPTSVEFAENNLVGEVVVTITVDPGVTVEFQPPPANPNNPFRLEANNFVAARVLDYETEKSLVAQVICTATSGLTLPLRIIVIVTNVNDNPPVFEQSLYQVQFNELSPVGTTVGRYPATDLDGDRLYYTLTPESSAFKLASSTNPEILVETPLEYDKVKNVQLVLYAQDTPLAPANSRISLTSSTTIMVPIVDVDNRPPWFKPCIEYELGGALICQSSGYTGTVIFNEQETGALALKPGPLYAIDGDTGIDEEITYSFVGGNGDGLFAINQNTGNITMLKQADVLETISLTVLAGQKINSFQFSTTTVTISVQVKSLHPPQFQRPLYEGVITAVGSMAMDLKNKDEPLRILATDDDYIATGGVNPHITYQIKGSSDFSIIDGFLFMTKEVPEATIHLQVVAVDSSNEESATAQLSVEMTTVCSVPTSVEFAENNLVGEVVVTITVDPGVTVEFQPPPANPNNPFRLEANNLVAARVLDYETEKSLVAQVICTATSGLTLPLRIIVIVTNVNDNPPVFEQSLHQVQFNELSPVGTTVGRYPATDLDGDWLYYTLTPESSAFKLASSTNPEILVETPLEYDKVKNVQLVLYAQDTPLAPANSRISLTSSTTIMVPIVDVDNRPPWFKPCIEYELGGALICQSSGYTGTVIFNEQETGALALKPGPLYAIDGDTGIDEEITYSFVGGNGDGLFAINQNTGNITMLKQADVLETISLTVLAGQKINSFQFSTTTVTISVQVKSLHPPQFQRPLYEGVITAVGSMAMDLKNKDEPLRILATDDDYIATGGVNPHITYQIKGSSDFSIIDGFLFMTKEVPEATIHLQVVAVDSSNEESATAQLSVEMTTAIVPSGGYGPADMAALGATLGVLLFVCLVVIGVLIFQIRRGKADWQKIYETSMFRSSLGQGNQKEGIQYTNDAFQNDEDGDSTGSGGPEGGSVMAGDAGNIPHYETVRSLATLNALLHDDTSQAGSDKSDSDKEVKPILTKDRRVDEGYKSVWFKEDIDPDAKEEVVIIPDSRESDSEEEDHEQSSSSREDEDDDLQIKTPRVFFNDADLDSGLGVKMEDPAEDSEDDKSLTVDL